MKLLERAGTLRELNAALNRATAGQGCLVLISGEAGVGKTSLIECFTAVHNASTRVLWGACDALFTPRPLGPLHDIAAQTQGSLYTLLTTAASRTDLFSALISELQQPSIVVFEDVHWADEATLDVLKFLSRRAHRSPSMIILSYRNDELGPRHPLRLLIGDLIASAATRRIELTPLSEDAVRHLVGERALDPTKLHRQTGGNPFFVTETIASGAYGIPSSIRDAVLARVARLSVSGRAVLEAAAVIGSRIEPLLLAEVVGAEAVAVGECIDVGMLIAQGEVLTFRHDLARQTILEAVSPQHKLVLHRLVLQALKSTLITRRDLSRLAHHAEAAGDPEAVLTYAPAAARQAAAASAHREAAAQYKLALRFADDLAVDEQALLLELYADECNMIDQRVEAITVRRKALELWRTRSNQLKQGENLALLATMLFGIGQTAEAEQASQSAIDLLEALPPSRELGLAYRTQAALRMFNRDLAEAVVWGKKAIVLAERFKDSETLAATYNAIGSAQILFDYEQGCASLEHSLVIAREAKLELHIANTFSNLGSASGEVYQFFQAERYLKEGIAFATEHDVDTLRLYMQAWLALTYLRLGRWNAAAELAAIVLQRPNASAISRIMALVAIGRLRARRGDPGVAEALDEALTLAEQTGHLQRLGPVRIARAEAAWLAGNYEQARNETQAVYELAVSKRHAWLTGELGFWCWRAGEHVLIPAWTARPYALHMMDEWRAAAEAWEGLGCPYEQAMALMDGDTAAQLQSLKHFEHLGAGPAAELVQHKLSTVTQRHMQREQWHGLSPREREVAALIAQGKSNREIAETMMVGVKTIETYVTRILNKLGFDSRVRIATWALEKGLAPSTPRSEH